MFGDPTIVITKHDLDTLRADAVLKYAEYLQAEQRLWDGGKGFADKYNVSGSSYFKYFSLTNWYHSLLNWSSDALRVFFKSP